MRERGAAWTLILGLALTAGCGQQQPPPRGSLGAEDQAALCQAAKDGVGKLGIDVPEDVRRAMVKAAETACREGFVAAEDVASTPAPNAAAEKSSGCEPVEDINGKPAAPISRRRLPAPARPIPYFAPRPGALPRDGAPTVAGVRLPAGSRCPHFWVTDVPTVKAPALADRLAKAFSRTGLWPVLWERGDEPDDYATATGRPSAVDRLDARTVLRRAWTQYRGTSDPYPGFAAGPGGSARLADPFQTITSASGYRDAAEPRETLEGDVAAGWLLLLVPVHRPADAIVMLNVVQSEYITDKALTAIARSWEERFGAVVTMMGAGSLSMTVSGPPTSRGDALALAGEHQSASPEGAEDDRRVLAASLLTDGPDSSRRIWGFRWAD